MKVPYIDIIKQMLTKVNNTANIYQQLFTSFKNCL